MKLTVSPCRALALALLGSATVLALAQPRSTSAHPAADPLHAAAPLPPPDVGPAWADYRRHAEPPRRDWKDANAEVGRIGGWRAYAREAQRTLAPAPAASNPVGRPAHAGH